MCYNLKDCKEEIIKKVEISPEDALDLLYQIRLIHNNL